MNQFFEFLCLILMLSTTNARQEITHSEALTKVVNHEFLPSSLSVEDKNDKKTLKELHTYAELKDDPRSSLPDSFTICSTAKTTLSETNGWAIFFSILTKEKDQLLISCHADQGVTKSGQAVILQKSSKHVSGKTPVQFPNKWTISCAAIDTNSGTIHWVVEGILIMTEQFPELTDKDRLPTSLTNTLVLGVTSYGGSWRAKSNQVTHINIFSAALSIEKMKSVTRTGKCDEEGDYLAWRDMEWILHGQARTKMLDKEEPCEKEPFANLFYTPFPRMEACMYHCEKLGTRSPSVATSEEYATLQIFLKAKLFDKGLDNLQTWLPVKDEDVEGVWTDFYDGKPIQDYTPPWFGGKPDGGTAQNCARQASPEFWGDDKCFAPRYACLCSHVSRAHLNLRGLCSGSAIDAHYKPMNGWKDSRELTIQGLTRTSIVYDEDKKIWTLTLKDSNVTGTLKAPHASYTLGRQRWAIQGDTDCNTADSYDIDLKMSGCLEGKFTCNDGGKVQPGA